MFHMYTNSSQAWLNTQEAILKLDKQPQDVIRWAQTSPKGPMLKTMAFQD